jgi:hypothetical protein
VVIQYDHKLRINIPSRQHRTAWSPQNRPALKLVGFAERTAVWFIQKALESIPKFKFCSTWNNCYRVPRLPDLAPLRLDYEMTKIAYKFVPQNCFDHFVAIIPDLEFPKVPEGRHNIAHPA